MAMQQPAARRPLALHLPLCACHAGPGDCTAATSIHQLEHSRLMDARCPKGGRSQKHRCPERVAGATFACGSIVHSMPASWSKHDPTLAHEYRGKKGKQPALCTQLATQTPHTKTLQPSYVSAVLYAHREIPMHAWNMWQQMIDQCLDHQCLDQQCFDQQCFDQQEAMHSRVHVWGSMHRNM